MCGVGSVCSRVSDTSPPALPPHRKALRKAHRSEGSQGARGAWSAWKRPLCIHGDSWEQLLSMPTLHPGQQDELALNPLLSGGPSQFLLSFLRHCVASLSVELCAQHWTNDTGSFFSSLNRPQLGYRRTFKDIETWSRKNWVEKPNQRCTV